MNEATTTLYRPVGPKELALIEASGFREFPPRLPQQPIFYPVLNEAYAIQIARDWNTKQHSRVGFVTRFDIDDAFVVRFERHIVGSRVHEELWVPAEELVEFNRHIVGRIEVVAAYFGDGWRGHTGDATGTAGLFDRLAAAAEEKGDSVLARLLRVETGTLRSNLE